MSVVSVIDRRVVILTLLAALLGAGWRGVAEPAGVTGAGEATYQHVATWETGALTAELTQPAAVALDWEDNLWVADIDQGRIVVIPQSGAPHTIDAPENSCFPRGHERGECRLVPIALAADEFHRRIAAVWAAFAKTPEGLERITTVIDIHWWESGSPGTPGSAQRVSWMMAGGGGYGIGVDEASGRFLVSDESGTVRHYGPSGAVEAVTNVQDTQGVNGRLAVLRNQRLAVPDVARGVVRIWKFDGAALGEVPIDQGQILDLAYHYGEILVLVRPSNPFAADAVGVVRVDPDTQLVTGTVSLGELAMPAVPAFEWTWDMAASAEGVAIVTGETNFVVHEFDESWTARRQIAMATLAEWQPWLGGPSASGAKAALAADPDGGVLLYSGTARALVGFAEDGTPELYARVPRDTVDLVALPDGLLVTTADDRLARLGATTELTATWWVTCACARGGRLAVVGSVAYVTRPRDQEVAAFDMSTGAAVGQARLPDAVGLWPSDVAVSATGRLLTADLVTSQIQTWLEPSAPEVVWQAGLLAGPRRLSARALDNGAHVLAAIMADGFIELHETNGGNLLDRFRPVTSSGAAIAPADVALGGNGDLYLASSDGSAVYVFRQSVGPTPTSVPNPSATPTPSDRSCRVAGNKVAGPDTVILGDSASVTLTLSADCPVRTTVTGADIVLVIDRSGSMAGANMAAAKAAATSFVELLDVRYHRIGIVSFSEGAGLDVPLSTSSVNAADGIALLNAAGGTNITEGLRVADEHLQSAGRADALPVIVLLSDGRHGGPVPPGPVAAAARNRGTQIYTIGLGSGADEDVLREIAGGTERYFFAPSPEELFPIYTEILRLVVSSLAGNLVIDDEMSDFVTYLGGSARPPALEGGERLRWGRSLLPATGITLTYDILPIAPGLIPTNRQAVAEYTDGDGVRRTYEFPVPRIMVITPTPTPTPEPKLIFLPSAFKSQCIPGRAHADVVLLIDTSGSMAGEKMEAAKAAALSFLDNLDLDYDQAAVIGFDAEPRVASGLTHSRAALVQAVESLSVRQGTLIDRALTAAEIELRYGSGRNPANRGVVVLMSDGAHNGAPDDVLAAANNLRPHTSAIYAIGLGADVDAGLLRRVASPGAYYFAPSTDELRGVYREIAVRIPCR